MYAYDRKVRQNILIGIGFGAIIAVVCFLIFGRGYIASTDTESTAPEIFLAGTTWSNDDMMLQFYENGKVGLYLSESGTIAVFDWIIADDELTLYMSEQPDVEPMTYSVAITDLELIWGPFVLRQ